MAVPRLVLLSPSNLPLHGSLRLACMSAWAHTPRLVPLADNTLWCHFLVTHREAEWTECNVSPGMLSIIAVLLYKVRLSSQSVDALPGLPFNHCHS